MFSASTSSRRKRRNIYGWKVKVSTTFGSCMTCQDAELDILKLKVLGPILAPRVSLAIAQLLNGLGLENASLKEMWAKLARHFSLEVLAPHKSEVP